MLPHAEGNATKIGRDARLFSRHVAFVQVHTALWDVMRRYSDMLELVYRVRPDLLSCEDHEEMVKAFTYAHLPLLASECNAYLARTCTSDASRACADLIRTRMLGFDARGLENSLATETEVLAWMDSLP